MNTRQAEARIAVLTEALQDALAVISTYEMYACNATTKAANEKIKRVLEDQE